MPAKCSRCGEYTSCRKKMVYCDLTQRPEWSFNQWICKKCDRAEAIIREEEKTKQRKKEKDEQAKWIKERNKILKQHEK